MKRLIIYTVALLLFTPLLAASMGRLPFGKPDAPLHVEILQVADDEGVKKEVVMLIVNVTSYADSQEVSVKISLHGKVKLLSGELVWNGPLKKGEVKGFPLSLKLPMKGNAKVSASASVRLSEGTLLSSSDSIRFDSVRKKLPPKPPVKKDGKGRDIVEERL